MKEMLLFQINSKHNELDSGDQDLAMMPPEAD